MLSHRAHLLNLCLLLLLSSGLSVLNSQQSCRQTKGLKEVKGFCRNVWLSEQSCILECIIGNCSFPNTVAASTLWQEPRVFVSPTAELFPCSDSSAAVSTRVKAAALCSTTLTLPGETHREANVTLRVARVLQSSAPCEPCLVCGALGTAIA